MESRKLAFLVFASGLIGGLVGRIGIMPANAADVPQSMAYQALLSDASGKPVTGTYEVSIRLFSSVSGGAPVCSDGFHKVNVLDGVLKVVLGGGNAIGKDARCGTAMADAFASHQELYLEVTVGDETLSPRALISSVGHAFHAQLAESANEAQHARHASDGVPPGAVVAFAVEDLPPDWTGWLKCDGSTVSKTDYAALYGVIKDTWARATPAPDGEFYLPDLRGRFLRGAHGLVGKTLIDADGDRKVGTVQGGSTAMPINPFITQPAGAHGGHWNGGIQGVPFGVATPVVNNPSTFAVDNHTHAVTGGDTETRPTNSAVNYFIKF